MAAIARKAPLVTAALLLLSGSPLLADRAGDIRSQISYVATSLASGSAADALGPFDKSYASYEKLSGYFQGLTVFQIKNEVDLTEEDDTGRRHASTGDQHPARFYAEGNDAKTFFYMSGQASHDIALDASYINLSGRNTGLQTDRMT